MSAASVMPVEAVSALNPVTNPIIRSPLGAGPASFSSLLVQGIEGVNTKALQADDLARAFAVDDSIPVHQVTFALEEARLSLELMLQVRGRMVEAYQQFMNMQL